MTVIGAVRFTGQIVEYKMEKADAALRADIESPAPTDKARRITRILELQVATDDYIEKISRLRE